VRGGHDVVPAVLECKPRPSTERGKGLRTNGIRYELDPKKLALGIKTKYLPVARPYYIYNNHRVISSNIGYGKSHLKFPLSDIIDIYNNLTDLRIADIL
jgi:hypothetical protein